MAGMTDRDGNQIPPLTLTSIQTDEKIETLDFLLSCDELEWELPEELYLAPMVAKIEWTEIVENERISVQEVKGLDDLEFVKFLGKGGFS